MYASAVQQAVREIDDNVLGGYVLSCNPQHRTVNYEPQRTVAADEDADRDCIVLPWKAHQAVLRTVDDTERCVQRNFEELAQAPLEATNS
jgi:hypothetical protein